MRHTTRSSQTDQAHSYAKMIPMAWRDQFHERQRANEAEYGPRPVAKSSEQIAYHEARHLIQLKCEGCPKIISARIGSKELTCKSQIL